MADLQLKEIKSIDYERPEISKGYSDHILSVNISDSEITIDPVDEKIKEIFVGGKGYDLWLMWNSVTKNTKWNDPENPVCIASGPMSGNPNYPGSGKSIVTSISPITGIPIDSNVGGYFGPYLKFAGFDAMKIQGKSDKELIVYIDGIDSKIQIMEVDGLTDDSYNNTQVLTKHFGKDKPRGISVVSAGSGAENSLLGCLNFSWYDPKRKLARYKQAGRGGIGSVFAEKNIKALVVRWDKVKVDINKPADLEAFKVVARNHTREIRELDPKQNDMATVGTTHLVTIMNDHDTLPVRNFKFGRHPEAVNLGEDVYRPIFDKGFDGCWYGCAVACAHGVRDFVPMTGPFKGQKVFVDGPEYETIAGVGSNMGIFDPHFVLEMNFYCDNYGVDTISIGTATAFIMECFELGLITEEHTGMDLSFGNKFNALELLHELARGEGFGKILGQGIRRMKKIFADEYGADEKILLDIGMESKGLEFSEYISKESLAQQGGYGLGLKGAQHDEAWLIFLDAVHNFMPTFEQKAENLHWFPMFRTWFSLCGLCKLPWNDIVPEDNKDMEEPAKVIKHVEWYIEYFTSVTGRELDQDKLIKMSEGVYNFQRLFNLKMGYGKREHDTLPYRAVGPVFTEEYNFYQEKYDTELKEKCQVDPEGKTTEEKVAALRKFREGQYELLKDAVYAKRGWTPDGIPTLEKVKSLGIDFPDVVDLLKENGIS